MTETKQKSSGSRYFPIDNVRFSLQEVSVPEFSAVRENSRDILISFGNVSEKTADVVFALNIFRNRNTAYIIYVNII